MKGKSLKRKNRKHSNVNFETIKENNKYIFNSLGQRVSARDEMADMKRRLASRVKYLISKGVING